MGRSTVVGLVVGVLMGAAFSAGMALASHDENVIHACVRNATGAARIVDDPSSCGASESPIEWSIQGPEGPQGPPGIAATYLRRSSEEVPGGESRAPTADCDSDDLRTGGGYGWHELGDEAFTSDPALETVASFPEPNIESWTAIGHNGTANTHELEAFVVCADVTEEAST